MTTLLRSLSFATMTLFFFVPSLEAKEPYVIQAGNIQFLVF